MSNTATRLITLIMMLQRRPHQKAAELAAELGVSVRSLHRYVGMLEEIGIPVCSERGPQGGFSLVRGYRMPPLVFTPEEAVAVYLGTSLVSEMWGNLYKEAARGALAKLDNVLPDEQRHEVAWARRSLVATGMNRADHERIAPYLEKTRRAIRQHRQLQMLYQGRSRPQALQRDIAPYALVHRWGWWYVVGHCYLRDALRSFRVDRILELALLGETFNVPADFDIHAYLETEPVAWPQTKIRLRFSPQGAPIAQENQAMWEEMEEQANGALIVTTAVPDLQWGASLVLSFGSLAEVIAPEELRYMVRDWAQAIVSQHE